MTLEEIKRNFLTANVFNNLEDIVKLFQAKTKNELRQLLKDKK